MYVGLQGGVLRRLNADSVSLGRRAALVVLIEVDRMPIVLHGQTLTAGPGFRVSGTGCRWYLPLLS